LSNALTNYESLLYKRNFPKKYVAWGRSKYRDFYKNLTPFGFELDTVFTGDNAILPFLRGGLTPSGSCYSKHSIRELDGFIDTNHKLAPSDSITMWRLALSGFSFEMASNTFFLREYASTAIDLTGDASMALSHAAIQSFLIAISPKEKQHFIKFVKENDTTKAIFFTVSLVKYRIINRFSVIKIILINLLKFQFNVRSKELIYLLICIFRTNILHKAEVDV
jgi:hypothetical protein